MKNSLSFIVIVITAILFFAGCSNTNKTPEQIKASQMALHDTWVLIAIDGMDINSNGLPNGAPTLEIFVEENRYLGNTGCNNYQGKLELSGETITFLPGPMTLMACPDMKLEQDFIQRLRDGTLTFQRTNGYLLLTSEDNTSLEFKKTD